MLWQKNVVVEQLKCLNNVQFNIKNIQFNPELISALDINLTSVLKNAMGQT